MDFEVLYQEIVDISGSAYHAKHKQRIKYTWEKVHPLISSDSTVLDIGVGPISALIRRVTGARVVGLSLTDRHNAMCEAYNIELRTCDLEAELIPLEDASVDVVLLMEVIEHLCVYPNKVLDDIYNKLKPGGHLVVSTVNFLRISNRIRMLMGRNPLISHFERTEDGGNHIREFVPEEMSYYMKKSGFSIQQERRFGIASGPVVVAMLLRLAYFYPPFRNYFLTIGKK